MESKEIKSLLTEMINKNEFLEQTLAEKEEKLQQLISILRR